MATITKKDLVNKIAAESGIPRPDVQTVVEGFLKNAKNELQTGNRIEIRNFGVFEIKVRKPRIGRNPKKPEDVVQIPARKVVHFKVGREFKKVIDQTV